MNKIIRDPFTHFMPKVDLHGETTDTFKCILNSFINDNIKLGNQYIIAIHGKGSGVLRKAVMEYLSRHKDVLEYNMDPLNEGQVIIKIKLQ